MVADVDEEAVSANLADVVVTKCIIYDNASAELKKFRIV